MRSALLALLLLLPGAAADHRVGHAGLPGEHLGQVLGERLNGTPAEDLPALVRGHCREHVEVDGHHVLGVPVPRRVREAHVECHVGGIVLVTPDPFHDGSESP